MIYALSMSILKVGVDIVVSYLCGSCLVFACTWFVARWTTSTTTRSFACRWKGHM